MESAFPSHGLCLPTPQRLQTGFLSAVAADPPHALPLCPAPFFTVSSFCFAPFTRPLCTDPLSPFFHTSSSLFLPLSSFSLSLSADLTNYKVKGELPFSIFAHPKVCLRARLSVPTLLWCLRQGVYLCIHTLKDFQIAVIRLSSTNKKIFVAVGHRFVLSSLFCALLRLSS